MTTGGKTMIKKVIMLLKWLDSVVQDKKYLSELKKLETKEKEHDNH